MITRERLVEVLSYDKESGHFSWRFTGKGKKNSKQSAGAVSDSGSGKTYIKIRIDGVLYFAHRLAWLWVTGQLPVSQIDHVDGDGTNNRFENLRESNQTENLGNVSKKPSNTSGFKGVCRSNSKWLAQITHKGKNHYLGVHYCQADAAEAYDAAAVRLFGKFARTNRMLGLL